MVHVPFSNPDIFPQKQVQPHQSFTDGKEYVVALNEGVDYDQFWEDMENPTSGLTHVPDRNIRVLHELPGWQRLCHYILTDDEAEILRKDPRVKAVTIPFESIPGLVRTPAIAQIGNFNKPLSSIGDFKNWGLLRTNYATNPYTLTTNQLTVANQYDYTLDGSNVDVVIMDTGIQADHPEFTDANGVSRIKKITWFKEAGYGDYVDLNKNIVWKNIGTEISGPMIDWQGHIRFLKDGAVSADSYDYEGQVLNLVNNITIVQATSPPGSRESGYMYAYTRGINCYHGNTDSNQSYTIRWQGQTNLDEASASYGIVEKGITLDYQIKFCSNNAIEITMIRHDYCTTRWPRYNLTTKTISYDSGRPEFGLTTFSGNTTTFTDSFRNKPQLVNRSDQPYSIVLTTADNGENWVVNENSHMVYSSGVWTMESGAATITPTTSLTIRLEGVGNFGPTNFYQSVPFGTPFSFKVGKPLRKEFYTDYHGHGTHCAGIAAGKTFGWAKKSNIYVMKLNDLVVNNPDMTSGFNELTGWNLIKLFHQNKPVNPVTGVKNPTIVNMSFGTSYSLVDLNSVTGGVYRNSSWIPTTNPDNDYGLGNRGVPKWKYYPKAQAGASYPKGFWYFISCNFDISDIGLEELANAGVICCVAAGNNGMRADTSSGLDYGNYFAQRLDGASYTFHYNRGCSPQSNKAVMVGAIDFVYPSSVITNDTSHARASNNLNNQDQIAYFSNTGSLVDIYAPGVNIMSSTSNSNLLGGVYYADAPAFKQVSISGTSMATPQVVGLLALYMQQNPTKTPAQAKQWLIDNSKAALYSTNLDNDYNTYYSLKGGPNRQMCNPLSNVAVTLLKPGVNDVGTAGNPVVIYKNTTNNSIDVDIIGTATSLNIPFLALHGTTNVSGLKCTYTPAKDYVGTDTFKYTATNSSGTSNIATVYINVISANAAPVANNITTSVKAKTTNNIIPLSVVGSYDIVYAATLPKNGIVTINGNTLYYTPKSVTIATGDFFAYAVSNSIGTSNIATVNISIIQPAYPIPEALSFAVTVPANVTSTITTKTYYATLIVVGSTGSAKGTWRTTNPDTSSPLFLDIKEGITFEYTPPPGYTGTDYLIYYGWQYHSDGSILKSASASIEITIKDIAPPSTGLSISNGVVMTNGINLRLI